MSAVAAIRALLVADAAVTALCPATKIMAGVVPQGTALPALSITHISTVEISRIDAQAASGLVQSRVQVMAMAKDYPGVKALLVAVRKACNYKRGTLAAVSVVSIVRDMMGPDMTDDDATIVMQSIDFRVIYEETH